MFRVETYENPHNYFKNMIIDNDELHIAGTSSFTTHLKDNLNRGRAKSRVWTFGEFEEALYDEWYNSINILKMKVELRQLIEMFVDDEHQVVFRKDINSILDSFRYLCQVGFDELEIYDELSIEKKLIRLLYNKFINTDFIREMNKFNKLSESLIVNKLNKYYNRKLDNSDADVDINKIDTIYFYNLKYIDMKRYVLLRRLLHKKIKIIFRIPYFSTCSNINEPWINLYQDLQTTDMWKKGISDSGLELANNKYLSYLEGVDYRYGNKTYSFKEFNQPIDFKEFLKKNKIFQNNDDIGVRYKENLTNELKEYRFIGDVEKLDCYKYIREYIAFSNDELNQCFKRDIICEDNLQHHYFDYNQGKFLQCIYRGKWLEDEGLFELSYEDYCKCILSGWIEYKDKDRIISGKEATDILMDISPYMEGIKTLEDILDRLNNLTMLHDFDTVFNNMSKDRVGSNRIKRYLLNPLSVLPYSNNINYSITVKQLIRLTNRLYSIIKQLTIGKSNITNVNQHLIVLDLLYKSLSIAADGIIINEKTVGEILAYRVDDDNYDINIKEMGELVNILFSSSNDNLTENRIKAFDQIEGIIINGTQEIYLTDLSLNSYENYINKKKYLPSYFTAEELLRDVNNINADGKKKVLIEALKSSEKSIQNVSTFIRFDIVYLISFFRGKLHISWIDNIKEYDQESSLFKILKNLYKGEQEDLKNIYTYPKSKYNEETTKEYDVDYSVFNSLAPTAWLDLDYCPRKFFYSNIIQNNPIYRDDFNQRIVFATLAQLFTTAATKEEIVDWMYPLFPQWNDTLKDDLIDTSYRRDINESYRYDNIKFPKHMGELIRLRSKPKNDRRKFRQRYNNRGDINASKEIKQFIDTYIDNGQVISDSGRYCSMCPYSLICVKEVYYGTDR